MAQPYRLHQTDCVCSLTGPNSLPIFTIIRRKRLPKRLLTKLTEFHYVSSIWQHHGSSTCFWSRQGKVRTVQLCLLNVNCHSVIYNTVILTQAAYQGLGPDPEAHCTSKHSKWDDQLLCCAWHPQTYMMPTTHKCTYCCRGKPKRRNGSSTW